MIKKISSKNFDKLEKKVIKNNDLKKKNARVYYSSKKNFQISNKNIDLLKKFLIYKNQDIFRICFHKNDKEQINEMLIMVKGNFSNKPHKQKKSSVSYHLIEGSMLVNLHDNSKKIIKKYIMGTKKNNLKFLRLDANIFRSLSCLGKITIFLETSCGPYYETDTLWLD